MFALAIIKGLQQEQDKFEKAVDRLVKRYTIHRDSLREHIAASSAPKAIAAPAESKPKPRRTKHYKKGTHWMQRPENRTRVLAMLKKAHAARRRNKRAAAR